MIVKHSLVDLDGHFVEFGCTDDWLTAVIRVDGTEHYLSLAEAERLAQQMKFVADVIDDLSSLR